LKDGSKKTYHQTYPGRPSVTLMPALLCRVYLASPHFAVISWYALPTLDRTILKLQRV